MTFSHRESLDGSFVLWELYNLTSQLTSEMQGSIGDHLSYVGYESVRGDIAISLSGINQTMDGPQMAYFSNVTTHFLSKRLGDDMLVMNIEFVRQVPLSNRHVLMGEGVRHLLSSTTELSIEGEIRGAQRSGTPTSYLSALEQILRDDKDQLLQELVWEGIRQPGTIDGDKLVLFTRITTIDGKVLSQTSLDGNATIPASDVPSSLPSASPSPSLMVSSSPSEVPTLEPTYLRSVPTSNPTISESLEPPSGIPVSTTLEDQVERENDVEQEENEEADKQQEDFPGNDITTSNSDETGSGSGIGRSGSDAQQSLLSPSSDALRISNNRDYGWVILIVLLVCQVDR